MKKIIFLAGLLTLSFYQTRAQDVQPLITGGFSINITEAPWQVLSRLNGIDWCGGIIIAPNFILTSKHCITVDGSLTGPIFPASSLSIIAGITCKNEINNGNTFNVSRIIPHPDTTIDAALLQLSSNITFNSSRQPINYWGAVDTLYNVGNQVRASGWGWTIPNWVTPANCLQAVDLNIISNQEASDVFRPHPAWNRDLHDHEMAATGTGNIRQGACHGDSGGPLTIQSASNEPILIGIVQGGIPGCGGDNQGSPSVFVRVSHVVDWINDEIISISGLDALCGGITSGIYTITNPPQDATITWKRSNNHILLNGASNAVVGDSVIVTRNPAIPAGSVFTSELTATITTPNLSPIKKTKSIAVGTRPDGLISTHLNNQYLRFGNSCTNEDWITLNGNPIAPNNPYGITRGNWTPLWAPGVGGFSISPFNHHTHVDMTLASVSINPHPQNIPTQIQVNLENACGTSNWQTIIYRRGLLCPGEGSPFCPICLGQDPNCFCRPAPPACFCGMVGCPYCSVIFSPNPVSDVLTIDLSSKTQAETQTRTSSCFSSRTTSDGTISDIRLLNAHGLVVRQQRATSGQIQFDVSRLPEGTYYLHIEHNGEIQKHQIIVNRN